MSNELTSPEGKCRFKLRFCQYNTGETKWDFGKPLDAKSGELQKKRNPNKCFFPVITYIQEHWSIVDMVKCIQFGRKRCCEHICSWFLSPLKRKKRMFVKIRTFISKIRYKKP